jgi:hypothetical protein
MPRLTNESYLQKRTTLVWAWEHNAIGFDAVQTWEQRDLHGYFAPDEPLSSTEAIQYRKYVTRESPGLPSQAGRAYATFEVACAAYIERMSHPPIPTVPVKRPKGAPRPKRVVRVSAIARPKIDVKRIARILVELAIEDERTGGEISEMLLK